MPRGWSKILKEKYKHIDREYLLQGKALMASKIRQALGYAGSGRTPAPPRPNGIGRWSRQVEQGRSSQTVA